MKYYPINEDLARRAKEMNSYFDYIPGSATQAYQRAVDRAAEMAEFQKQRVDPIHHEKIDCLLDTYARKLAENIDKSNSISTRVPSILISGGGNFPVRKKEKQNQAAEANMEEWRQIRGLLDKIRSTGLGGISADEPDAVAKLKAKLVRLEAFQDKMKAVNAFYERGFFWEENGTRLYDILDRVSCWCCKNKNRKELKAIYQYLPQYWEKLKELQAQIPMPMKPYSRKGVPYGNVFDLEKVFEQEIRAETSGTAPQQKRRRHEQGR